MLQIKKISHNTVSTSIVIGVILMVALTVSMSSVVYLYMLNNDPGKDPAITNALFIASENIELSTLNTLTFANADQDIDIGDLGFKATYPNGATTEIYYHGQTGIIEPGDIINLGDMGEVEGAVINLEIGDDWIIFTIIHLKTNEILAFFDYSDARGRNLINNPPTASDNTVTTSEDTSYIFVEFDFNFNFVDVDGDDLSKVQITDLETEGSLTLDSSDVTLDQEIIASDIEAGKLVFTPDVDESETPYTSFNFKVHDGIVYSTTAYTMTIDVTADNDPPIANDDFASTNEDIKITIDVLFNDTDLEDITLFLDSVTIPPNHGTAEIVESQIEYTPVADYFGLDSFEYRVIDSGALTDTAMVFITVVGINDPPIGVDDIEDTSKDTAVIIDVLNNDYDIDGAIDPTTVAIITDVTHGSTSVNAITGEVTYTPDSDYIGGDVFTYTVDDDQGDTSNEAIVSITITGPPWITTYGNYDWYGRSYQPTSNGGYVIAGFIDDYIAGSKQISTVVKTDDSGSVEWTKTYGSANPSFWAEGVQEISNTNDGGYILSGVTYTFLTDHPSGSVDKNAILIKTDSLGNKEWAKAYRWTTGMNSVQQVSDGGYAMTGSTYAYFNTNFPQIPHGYNNQQLLVIKTDSNGNAGNSFGNTWSKLYAKFDDTLFGKFIQPTVDGSGYLIAGTSSNDGLIIMKTSLNGDITWVKSYPDISNPSDFKQAADGSIIVTTTTTAFGSGSNDFLVMKLDSNGGIGAIGTWAKVYGETNQDILRSIDFTTDGGYILVGDTRNFGPAAWRNLLIKTDSNGEIGAIGTWSKAYDDLFQNPTDGGVHQLQNGYLVGSGGFGSGMLLMKTDLQGEIGCSTMFHDAAVISYDITGSITVVELTVAQESDISQLNWNGKDIAALDLLEIIDGNEQDISEDVDTETEHAGEFLVTNISTTTNTVCPE